MQKDDLKDKIAAENHRINTMTDEQLSVELQNQWETEDFPNASWTAEQHDRVWQKILMKTGADEAESIQVLHRHISINIIRWAAAVLLPVLLLSVGWLFYRNQNREPLLTTIETGFGEKATVCLPDGSTVRLNYNSRLSYDPSAINRGDRNVSLDGEAMFKVAKDASHPFTVNARGLLVKVLGTKFILRSRVAESRATLLLTEGKVNLSSTVTGEETTLMPIQKATLDYATNKIKINSATKNDPLTAWQRGELKFDEEPLAVVIATIEGNYGVKFVNVSASKMLNDRFSGTLPSENLNEALDIIEHTYGVDFKVSNKKIEIVKK